MNADGGQMRVLVVDDEPGIRQMLRAGLGDDGYDVREAANGADALAICRSWRPDAIVLDLMMPVMNGWQFAEAYGAQPGAKAPIIVITAAGPGAIRSTNSLGVISTVMAKPIQLDELRETLALHMGRQRA